MADSKLATPRSDTASPPPHCAICLGTCKNKCRANTCMHEFCYSCLLEWSRIKAECPLCKQEFKSILHNIKSINEYDVHIVENIPVENNRYLENASLIYLPPATPPMHHYQFRTTLTLDPSGEHAINQLLLHHPLLVNYNPERFTHHRRRRGDTSTTFRRTVYADNLWVYAPPDITGRYREVSPSYFRQNPAARTRLVPWLNRELNALLHENTQLVMRLVDTILDHLLRHHICSYMFRSLLYEYLGNKTDHFIHEFYNFMRSPYDMVGYDRSVIYTERRHTSPISFINEIDISDYDSDVILVSDTNNNQGTQENPVIIDLVETDSDEPIIVSEDRNEPRRTEDENRKPILPLKLRIKNRHRSKEKRRAKKRHRQQLTSSSSSSSSSEDSNPESDSDYDYSRRYSQKRHSKKSRKEKDKKKRKKDTYYVEKREVVSNHEDDEDDVPLANFARKKKKHSKHKTSHTDKKYTRKEESSDTNNNDYTDSSYSSDPGIISKPLVKSKVREVNKSDDKHKAGPSSGRLRNTLKKEANSNLWYSRPAVYDSDSSDS